MLTKMFRPIIAFLASIFTGVQIYLLLGEKKAICFNDGCALVDSLTAVPPLYFNIAGFLFFLCVFILSIFGQQDDESLPLKCMRLLLLAALSMEAVLVFFQYKIAQVFCSYCLIIFACIVLLNLLTGMKQTFRGLIIFVSVFLASNSLIFKAKGLSLDNLQNGMMSMVGNKQTPDNFLFFSRDCSHCERIIALIKNENTCAIGFNPIIPPEKFDLPQATIMGKYDAQFNKNLLDQLGFQQVPILAVISNHERRFIEGEKGITKYLKSQCQTTRRPLDNPTYENSGSSTKDGQSKILTGAESLWGSGKNTNIDGCSTSSDCIDTNTSSTLKTKINQE